MKPKTSIPSKVLRAAVDSPRVVRAGEHHTTHDAVVRWVSPDDPSLLEMEITETIQSAARALELPAGLLPPAPDAMSMEFSRSSAEMVGRLIYEWSLHHATWVDRVRRVSWSRGVATGSLDAARCVFTARLDERDYMSLAEAAQRELGTRDSVRCRLSIFVLTFLPSEVLAAPSALLDDAVHRLDARLRKTDPEWEGWERLLDLTSDWSTLAAERIGARERPWQEALTCWRDVIGDQRLVRFIERSMPLPPERPPGDARRLRELVDRVRVQLSRGEEALARVGVASTRKERTAAQSIVGEVEAELEIVFSAAEELCVPQAQVERSSTSHTMAAEAVRDSSNCAPTPMEVSAEEVLPGEQSVEVPAYTPSESPALVEETTVVPTPPSAFVDTVKYPAFEEPPSGSAPYVPELTLELTPEPEPTPEPTPEPAPVMQSSLPAPSAARAAPPAPSELPPEVPTASFEAYWQARWIDASNAVSAAPWRAGGYASGLTRRLETLLSESPLPLFRARILRRALDQLRVEEGILHEGDLTALAELDALPLLTERAVRPARLELLRHALRDFAVTNTPSWKCVVALEALAPTTTDALSVQEVNDLHELVSFALAPLRDLLVELATLTAQGEQAVTALRGALANEALSGPRLQEALDDARQRYRELVRRLWSACGGRVQRTHCRDAWTHFIEICAADLERLYPVTHGGSKKLVPEEEIAWIGRLSKRHAKIADREGAKHIDRGIMDESVREIEGAAREIVALVRRLANAHHTPPPSPALRRAVEAAHQLSANTALSGADVEARLARTALAVLKVTTAGRSPARADAHVNLDEFLRAPRALTALGPILGADVGVEDVRDPLRASACILEASTPVTNLEGTIRWAEDLHDLTLVEPLIAVLDDGLRRRVRDARSALTPALLARIDAAAPLVATLRAVATPSAARWEAALIEARTWAERAGADAAPAMVWLRWIDELRVALDADHRIAIERLRAHAKGLGDEAGSAALRALQSDRLADAVRIIREGDARESVADEGRATRWRWEALDRWRSPRDAIQGASGAQDLRNRWREGIIGDHHRDQRLRTLFRDEFLRDLDAVSSAEGVNVDGARLRRWMADQRMNPSALPQIADFGRLWIVTPQVPVTKAEIVQRIAEVVAAHPLDVVVVLTPGLTPEARLRAQRELRRRSLRGAVLDDVDLCRLLEPGGDRPLGPIGILEVALEQQQWTAVTPYQLVEGQLVRVEMYFGRALEAEQLWKQASFSRVFSGRALGKSALLRYVEQSEARRPLPSGNVLRVVYVPAAGIDSERAMVDRVLSALAHRLDATTWSPPRPHEEPSESLERCLDEHLKSAPKDALLFFLDEADVWVERELVRYEEVRERSLSFVMRSRLESKRDATGHPRVRFVVSGYRVTSTFQGAWSNWGEVLRLRPLDPDDAVALVVRPLARLGIDARAVARSLAFRCGYQPAVILRVGQALVERMEERERVDQRGQHAIEVRDDDVDAVLGDASVREKMLQIVRNNFQGNEPGGAVFGALLQEMLAQPAWQPLDDAVARVSERLRRVASDADTVMVPFGGGTLEEAVRSLLRDLHDRELLTSATGHDAYALRFPHLASVMHPLAEAGFVQEQLSRARAGRGTAVAEVSSALPPTVLDALRRHLGTEPGEVVEVPVVGGHWRGALTDPRVGLADRLGAGRIVEANADGVADTLAETTFPGRVLLGGIDLLRACLEPNSRSRLEGERYLIEEYGDGRWSPERIRWWFRRVRTYEFEVSNALDTIIARTGGMPVLLERVDRLLRHDLNLADGETIGATAWTQALDKLASMADDVAIELAEGPGALTARERQVLIMVSEVTAEMTTVSHLPSVSRGIAEDLCENWPLFGDERGLPFVPLRRDEWWRVRLLQLVGLLPVNARSGSPDERLCVVLADDPLRAIVRTWKELSVF